MHRLLALALLAASCGLSEPGDTHIDITVDPCEVVVIEPGDDTSAAELAGIEEAIAMWNALVGARFTLDEVPGAARLPIRFEDAPLAFYGVYEDEVGVVLVNRRLEDPGARAITIAHELGHAMGLFHVGGEQVSVMNETNLTTPPQAFDREALAELWGSCRR